LTLDNGINNSMTNNFTVEQNYQHATLKIDLEMEQEINNNGSHFLMTIKNGNTPIKSLYSYHLTGTNDNNLIKYKYTEEIPLITGNYTIVFEFIGTGYFYGRGDFIITKKNVTISGYPDLKSEIHYDSYDTKGNLTQYHKEGDIDISVVWAYNGTLPVVKCENIVYTTLETAVKTAASGGSSINLDNFWNGFNDIATNTSQQNNWKTFVTNLKNNSNLANTNFILYTYKPLVGISSVTDAAGITTYYEYYDDGRLKLIRDNDSNILQYFEYHYQEVIKN